MKFFKALFNYPTTAVIFFAVIAAAVLAIIFHKKLNSYLEKKNPKQKASAFILFFSVCGVICLILAIITEGETWSNMMHLDQANMFRQFRNYFYNAHESQLRRFSELYDSYSPMSILIYFIFGQFIPDKYFVDDDLNNYLLMIKNAPSVMTYMVIVISCAVLCYYIFQKKIRENGARYHDDIIQIILFFSFPVMYVIELGDVTALSFVMTAVFVLYRNSEKKGLRIISDILIAFAGAISVFPLIFAFMLLFDDARKNYKRFFGTVILCALLFGLPSIFTGVHGMFTYLKSLLGVNYMTTVGNASMANLLKCLGVEDTGILYIAFALSDVLAFFAMIILKEDWEKTAAASYIVINAMSHSYAIECIYLLIPFFLLMSKKFSKGRDWAYLTVITLAITPIPEWYHFSAVKMGHIASALNLFDFYGANNITYPISAAVMFIMLVISSIREFSKMNGSGGKTYFKSLFCLNPLNYPEKSETKTEGAQA